MNPWWLGLHPAHASVTCGGDTHRLRWEAGALQAIDHGDPEAERTLAALGGERCTCVDLLDAWARHDGDPRVLVLASRGPADPVAPQANWTAQLTALPRAVAPSVTLPSRATPRRNLLRRPRRPSMAAAGGWSVARSPISPPSPAGHMPPGTQSEGEVIALLGLGGAVPDRLVATVAATWAQRFEQADSELSSTRSTLHASMQGRVCATVRQWLGQTDVPVGMNLIEDRRAPTLTERAGMIQAELPFSWLAEVWSRGLGTVFGRFCLAASTVDGRTWTLTTVGPDLGPSAPIRIELPPSV